MPPNQFTPFSAFTTAPMFAGAREPQMFQPFNVNLGNGGMAGVAMQMLIPALAQSMMGKYGMMPSQFMPTQNLFDQFRSQQYHLQQQQAMQMASARDQASLQQTIAGAMRMTSGPLTQRQMLQARTMANDVQGILPYAQMFLGTEVVDSLFGSRGSATSMAQAVHRGSQMHRDPFSGALGFSGRAAGVLSQEMFERMYGAGTDIRELRGLSAGAAGSLFEEMSTRGLMGGSVGAMSAAEQMQLLSTTSFDNATQRRIAERHLQSRGIGVTEAGILSTQNQLFNGPGSTLGRIQAGREDAAALRDLPGVGDMLTTADAGRISSRIKSMSGVVSAMQDIFGDMGNPNAPMRELINGLEALSQGGLATMSPSRVEQMVRTTHNLAQASGIGIQGIMGLTAQSAALADQLGLDRSLAVQATQSSAAFSIGLRNIAGMSNPAFGAKGLDALTLLDQQLGVTASASPMANSLGGLLRLERNGMLKPGSEAAKLAADIRERRTGNLPTSEAQLMQILRRSGIDMSTASSVLMDEFSNQELIRDYNLGSLVRGQQGATDIAPRMADAMTNSLLDQISAKGVRDNLEKAGLSGNTVSQMARNAADQMASDFLNMDAATVRDPKKLNAAMGASFQSAFEAQIREQASKAGKAPAEIEALVANARGAIDAQGLGLGAVSDFNRRIRVDPALQGYGSAVNVHALQGTASQQQRESAYVEQEARGRLQSAYARLGRSGPLRRIVDAIQGTTGNEELGRVIARAFGGLPKEEIEALKGSGFDVLQEVGDMVAGAERDKGMLTKSGLANVNLYNAIVSGMIEGGGLSRDALDMMASVEGVKAEQLPAILKERAEAAAPDSAARKRYEFLSRAYDRLQEAGKGNTLPNALNARGLATDLLVGSGQLEGLLDRGSSTLAALGKEGSGAAAAQFLADSRAIADTMMGSTTDMQQLGAGAMKRMGRIRDIEAEMHKLVPEEKTLSQLLQGEGPAHLVKKARDLYGQLQGEWKQVYDIRKTGKLAGQPGSATGVMTASEQEILEKTAKFARGEVGTDPKAKTVDDLRHGMAGHAVSSLLSQMGEEAGRFGEGTEHFKRLTEAAMTGDRSIGLMQAVYAREGLIKMAQEHGYIAAGETSADKLEAGLGQLYRSKKLDKTAKANMQSLRSLSEPLSGVGRGDLGFDAVLERINRFSALPREGDKPDKDKKVALSGTVRIINPEALEIAGDIQPVGFGDNDVVTNTVSAKNQA